MSTKVREIIAMSLIAVFCVVMYIGKVSGWTHGFQFPVWLSVVVLAVIGLSLLWMLVRTVRGRLVERRVVFLYVGIAVALPLFMPLSQDIIVSDEVRAVYEAVQELSPGSRVLVSFDYDPASAPELQPMAESFMTECFRRDIKVVVMGLWPQGPQQANMAIAKALAREEIAGKDLKYGIDYANLGYQAGNEFVIQRMGSDFKSMFKTDYRGQAYDDIPLVRNVRNFSNIDYSFNLSAGFPGTVEWVQVAVDRYGLRMGAGNTAVQAPTIYPYLRSGQLVGLIGGMNGGAEFERLTSTQSKATKFMLSQSLAHIIVIAFVIIGNVAFFRSGRKSALRG
ncbi:MAG TPA: hypothetical protein VMY05_08435 [Acidobacteriota bacterium]|nr:hypothetical protein [Acidobacteriota bacterium]